MAVINPFPEASIREFVARTAPGTRYLFALLSAQRAAVIAEDVTGGFSNLDDNVIRAALESCWNAAGSSAPASSLRGYTERLYDRMVPDDDDDYTPYHSSVNSALACLVYAIESSAGADAAESSYFSASSLFDLADYLLQRDHDGTGYAEDLASQPITALAARSVVQDIEDLERGDVDLDSLRRRATTEGHQIASLAGKTA